MEKMIKRYSALIGQLDKATVVHSKSVAEISRFLAERMELDAEIAYKAGYLHDVGKMYIPSRILNKNCALDPLERKVVDLHAYYGYELIKEYEDDERIFLTALYHHGFNKPVLGYVPNEISEEVRKYIEVVHAADIYDAMNGARVYHEPFKAEVIFSVLASDSLCSEEMCIMLKGYDKSQRAS